MPDYYRSLITAYHVKHALSWLWSDTLLNPERQCSRILWDFLLLWVSHLQLLKMPQIHLRKSTIWLLLAANYQLWNITILRMSAKTTGDLSCNRNAMYKPSKIFIQFVTYKQNTLILPFLRGCIFFDTLRIKYMSLQRTTKRLIFLKLFFFFILK